MKIVIEVEGEKVSVVGPEAVRTNVADIPPGPPPADLLARAKKLGALSAGAAQFGTGAALAATASAGQPLKLPAVTRAKPGRRKRPRRSR